MWWTDAGRALNCCWHCCSLLFSARQCWRCACMRLAWQLTNVFDVYLFNWIFIVFHSREQHKFVHKIVSDFAMGLRCSLHHQPDPVHDDHSVATIWLCALFGFLPNCVSFRQCMHECAGRAYGTRWTPNWLINNTNYMEQWQKSETHNGTARPRVNVNSLMTNGSQSKLNERDLRKFVWKMVSRSGDWYSTRDVDISMNNTELKPGSVRHWNIYTSLVAVPAMPSTTRAHAHEATDTVAEHTNGAHRLWWHVVMCVCVCRVVSHRLDLCTHPWHAMPAHCSNTRDDSSSCTKCKTIIHMAMLALGIFLCFSFLGVFCFSFLAAHLCGFHISASIRCTEQ